MGSGRWHNAQTTLGVALVLGAAVGGVSSAAIAGGRRLWPRAFIDDTEVVAVAARLLLIVAVSSFFDTFNCIFRGKQKVNGSVIASIY
jgi:Na+-driven multidrug efflux pump